ncbi:SRPBCC domain-containing protein [Arthrobacter sp. TMT4-20]|uniref:SRPBCC domain-containing protein n=1 Tax=Arthrobacter sp. TB 23 TaxID=494419 RepID=UPI0002E32E82|nr:SRPBCC domain-containing protein [Arthrobacter sp. TB 23]
MTEPAFVHDTEIATSPLRLWEALTEGAVTRRYWSGRRVESTWVPGSPIRFYESSSETITHHGVVLEVDEPKRLSYTLREVPAGEDGHTDPQDDAASRITIDVEQVAGGGVRFRLVQDRLAEAAELAAVGKSWAPILTNLQALLENDNAQYPAPGNQ